jgi:hypothetical protein
MHAIEFYAWSEPQLITAVISIARARDKAGSFPIRSLCYPTLVSFTTLLGDRRIPNRMRIPNRVSTPNPMRIPDRIQEFASSNLRR